MYDPGTRDNRETPEGFGQTEKRWLFKYSMTLPLPERAEKNILCLPPNTCAKTHVSMYGSESM
jgi:hypothetical protein